MDHLDLALPDGRSLEVIASGPEDGTVLLFHVGTPMAAGRWELLTSTAAAHGFRTVTYSRPAYGRSTRRPGHLLVEAVDDVRAILAHFRAERFATIGWSGGGSRALACAAVLGARCAAATSVAALAPYSAGEFDWFAGMSTGNVKEFSAALEGEAALRTYLDSNFVRVSTLQGNAIRGMFGPALAGPQMIAADAFADFVATSFRASVAHGIDGWLDDDLALLHDWGFDLASIDRPVAIWHGGADTLVPVSHGRWLASRIPRARSHFPAQHDHMTLPVVMLDAIIEELVEMARS